MNCLQRNSTGSRLLVLGAALLALSPALAGAVIPREAAAQPVAPQGNAPAAVSANGAGVPFTAEKLTSLLPATVYFQGRSAPLQLRNAAGVTLADGQIVWASLVDTSGYSTSVQERYQFYLVTEGPLRVGDASIPAGAYGAGFLGDHFLLMDLGGHTLAQGPLQNDTALRRPRPLQIQADSPSAVKLYLGRHWVRLQADKK